MTPASLIQYLETLTLTGGDRDGQGFTVLAWERRFIRGVFNQPGSGALSIARGNGKSALVAAIATAIVDPDAPLHGRRREAVIVASSLAQARIVFEDVLSFLIEKGHDLTRRKEWKKMDSIHAAAIEHRATGARVKCIGSDPARAHGLRPFLILADEPAQWPVNQRDKMLAALKTGLGKVPGSRMVALGTRPADSQHWFSRLLDGGAGYSQSHHTEDTERPFTLKTIRRANPSLDHLPSLKQAIQGEARDCKTDPALLPQFKALRLNQGVADHDRQSLLEAGTWERCEIELNEIQGGQYVLGIDLAGGAAMSAAAAYWTDTGVLEPVAMFPASPGLSERGLRDGVGNLYQRMADRKELVTVPGVYVDPAHLLNEAAKRWGFPAAIVADRFRERELRQALITSQWPVRPLILRGQGFKDGSEDVRAFREATIAGRVRPAKSLLLRAGMAEAVTVADPSRNEKLAKSSEGGRRQRARDDIVAAAILAVAVGDRIARKPRRRRRALVC